MAEGSQSTREALLDAAEREMASFGIDGADLDAIRRRASQGNRSAIRYHFGGRDELVRAVAARRRAPVDALRSQLVASGPGAGEDDLAWAARVMVQPALVHLRTPGGCDYLIIMAEQIARLGVGEIVDAEGQPSVDSIRALNAFLLLHVVGSPAARRRRIGRSWLIAFALLADLARDLNAGRLSRRNALRQGKEVQALVVDVLQG